MTDDPARPKRSRWPWYVAAGFLSSGIVIWFLVPAPITTRARAIRIGMTSEEVAAILGWHRVDMDGGRRVPNVRLEGFTGETSLDWIINEIVVEFGWYRFPRTLETLPVVVHYRDGRVEKVRINIPPR